ncbi:MAG: hypothetical protein WCR67_01485 [Bacilli bacterium]
MDDKNFLAFTKFRLILQIISFILIITGSVLAILGGINFSGADFTNRPMAYAGIAVFIIGVIVLIVVEIIFMVKYYSSSKNDKNNSDIDKK